MLRLTVLVRIRIIMSYIQIKKIAILLYLSILVFFWTAFYPVLATDIHDLIIDTENEQLSLQITYEGDTAGNPNFLLRDPVSESTAQISSIKANGFTSLTQQEIAEIAWLLEYRDYEPFHGAHDHMQVSEQWFRVPEHVRSDADFMNLLRDEEERRDGYYSLLLESMVMQDYYVRFGRHSHPIGYDSETIRKLRNLYPNKPNYSVEDLLIKLFEDVDAGATPSWWNESFGYASDIISVSALFIEALGDVSAVVNGLDSVRVLWNAGQRDEANQLRLAFLSIIAEGERLNDRIGLLRELVAHSDQMNDPAFIAAISDLEKYALHESVKAMALEWSDSVNLAKNSGLIGLHVWSKIAHAKAAKAYAEASAGKTTASSQALAAKSTALSSKAASVSTAAKHLSGVVLASYAIYTNISYRNSYEASHSVVNLQGILATKIAEEIRAYNAVVETGADNRGYWYLQELKGLQGYHNIYHSVLYNDLVNRALLYSENTSGWGFIYTIAAEHLYGVSADDFLEWIWGYNRTGGKLSEYAHNIRWSYPSGQHLDPYVAKVSSPIRLRKPYSPGASQGVFPDGVRVSWVAQFDEQFNVYRSNSNDELELIAENLSEPYYFDADAVYGSTHEYAIQSCYGDECTDPTDRVAGYVGEWNCAVVLSPGSAVHDGEAGTHAIDVVTEPGCDWTVSRNEAWISVHSDSLSGSGSQTITYDVAFNGSQENRTGSLNIGGNTFNVTQLGTGEESIEGNYIYILGSQNSGVSGNQGYMRTWTVDVGADEELSELIFWRYNSFGESPSSEGLGIAAMLGSAPTIDSIVTSGGSLIEWWDRFDYEGEIRSSRNEVLDVPAPSAGTWYMRAYGFDAFDNARIYFQKNEAVCRANIDSSSVEASPGGGSKPISVEIHDACFWGVSDAPSWIAINNGSDRRGAGDFSLQVAPNPSMEPRSATLDVRGVKLKVQQRGQCHYLFDRKELQFYSEGGLARGSMRAQDSCTIAIDSSEDWVQVGAPIYSLAIDGLDSEIDKQSSNGHGTAIESSDITMSTLPNVGNEERQAKISVDGEGITIRQDPGAGPVLEAPSLGEAVVINLDNELRPVRQHKLLLTNPGSQPISVYTDYWIGWLEVSPSFISLEPGESEIVQVGVKTEALIESEFDSLDWVTPNTLGQTLYIVPDGPGNGLDIPVRVEFPFRLIEIDFDDDVVGRVEVTSTLGKEICEDDCEVFGVAKSEVTLRALKNEFVEFEKWGGDCDGQSIDCVLSVSSDKTVSAKFVPVKYTLNFDSAGGSEAATITAGYGTDIMAPTSPTRVGYTFDGWEPVVPDTMPAEDLTLTAQWTINKYTLTFVNPDGTGIAEVTQDFGSEVSAPSAPSRLGYTFGGWSPVLPDTMPAEDLTLTAQWTINEYTLTFDSAGGSSVDSIIQNFNSTVAAPDVPTRDGYTFDGWDQVVPDTMPAENLTLTAQWVATDEATDPEKPDPGDSEGDSAGEGSGGSGESNPGEPDQDYKPTHYETGAITTPGEAETFEFGDQVTVEWDTDRIDGHQVRLYALRDELDQVVEYNYVLDNATWELVDFELEASGRITLEAEQIRGNSEFDKYQLLLLSASGEWTLSSVFGVNRDRPQTDRPDDDPLISSEDTQTSCYREGCELTDNGGIQFEAHVSDRDLTMTTQTDNNRTGVEFVSKDSESDKVLRFEHHLHSTDVDAGEISLLDNEAGQVVLMVTRDNSDSLQPSQHHIEAHADGLVLWRTRIENLEGEQLETVVQLQNQTVSSHFNEQSELVIEVVNPVDPDSTIRIVTWDTGTVQVKVEREDDETGEKTFHQIQTNPEELLPGSRIRVNGDELQIETSVPQRLQF